MSGAAEAARTSRAQLRAILAQCWRAFHPIAALYCLPAIVVCLAAGVALDQPGAAMVSASGAFLAGFGAFQPSRRLPLVPMLMATLFMAVAIAIGTVAANNTWTYALCVGLAAFTVGLGTALGTVPWWVLLQGSIFMVLAGAQPGDLVEGLQRAAMVLAGGLVQMASLGLLRTLAPAGFPPLAAPGRVDAPARLTEWAATLRRLFRRSAPEPRFALLLALTAATAILVVRGLGLPHGYWVAIIVLLVLRRGGGETVTRGILAIAGCLIGAGLATLIAALLHPSGPMLIGLIVLSAWAAYSLQWVNYGTFSAAVTSYIAYLFTLLGAPEPEVAANRVAAVLIGGALAMLAFGAARVWRRALERAGALSAEPS